MFLKKIELKPSALHGLGIFTTEAIKAGEDVYKHDIRLSLRFDFDMMKSLWPQDREFIHHYGYPDPVYGGWRLDFDHIRFVNYSDDPNLKRYVGDKLIAVRDIAIGEELTLENYHK